MKILLIEDDLMLGQALNDFLERNGFNVTWVKDGLNGESQIANGGWKVIILDLGLPGKCGTDILCAARRKNNNTPVLILTARDAVQDKVKHLNFGADDYLVKPFDVDELLARINVLIRRFFGVHHDEIKHKDIVLNLENHKVYLKEKEIPLHKMEYSILRDLFLNKGKVVSRQKLEQSYDLGKNIKSNAVEVHIHHIRTKLYPSLIKTIRGVGYIVEKEA